ncbi:hypothetical protein SDC9_158788 [bioreactor metagenome]|uniref:Uncharacterized protein n=1 Tax=bioreactor metagenome TaxID=1076179 RepID=A0A645FAT2_9ZZZZ
MCIKTILKSAALIGILSISFVLVGCSKEPSGNSTTLSPDGKPVAVTDGTNTWVVGAVKIDGTNVSDTNVTVQIRAREVSK